MIVPANEIYNEYNFQGWRDQKEILRRKYDGKIFTVEGKNLKGDPPTYDISPIEVKGEKVLPTIKEMSGSIPNIMTTKELAEED